MSSGEVEVIPITPFNGVRISMILHIGQELALWPGCLALLFLSLSAIDRQCGMEFRCAASDLIFEVFAILEEFAVPMLNLDRAFH